VPHDSAVQRSPWLRPDPFVVAVDLLSQAEHGPDPPAVLVTTSRDVATAALEHVERILVDMPTRDLAGPAWRDHGQALLVDDLDEAFAVGATGFRRQLAAQQSQTDARPRLAAIAVPALVIRGDLDDVSRRSCRKSCRRSWPAAARGRSCTCWRRSGTRPRSRRRRRWPRCCRAWLGA